MHMHACMRQPWGRERAYVDAVALEAAAQRGERPLVSVVVCRRVRVVHKVCRVLVDRVVGEVHEKVLEVGAVGHCMYMYACVCICKCIYVYACIWSGW